MTTHSTLTLRSIRVLIVTFAVALTSAIGFSAGDVSADLRAPAVATGGGAAGGGSSAEIDTEVVLSQNTRAILMEEGKLAQGGRLADWSDVAATQANATAPFAEMAGQTIF